MEEKRTKLVLTGGGTRGIYQIGALKAMKELGLWDQVKSISGCSIGALNAAMISQYDIEDCYKIWQEIAKREVFKGINQFSENYLFQMAKETILNDGININPFIALFEEYIDPKKLKSFDKEIVITAYNITKQRQEYKTIDELPDKDLLMYFMASARLPFFKPIFIDGDKYVDGGVGDNQVYYSNLENRSFDDLICIKIMYIPYYIPGLRKNNITFENETIISPSGKIGNPIAFVNPSFDEKFEMGYQDTMTKLTRSVGQE